MTTTDFVLLVLLIATLCAAAWLAIRLARLNTNVGIAKTNVDAVNAARDDVLQRLRKAEGLLAESQTRLESAAPLATKVNDQAERIAVFERETQEMRGKLDAAVQQLADARQANAGLTSQLEAERTQMQEKIALLDQARTIMSDQFKSLANDILEDKSKKFIDTNREKLDEVLKPFREKLGEFRERVEAIHTHEAEQRGVLSAELAHLKNVSQQMTTEAHELATALKGQAKKQGNWGELVLGNVLDRSGLREGIDFRREVSFNTEEGRRRPDVIVYLPQSKHLVIDAKVSLNAYTRYVNAEDDLLRQQALNEHVGAIADRISELSGRNYFKLPGLNSPEIVFMFVPIESAFVEALRADEGLFQRAIQQNVLVATPTTLLTSLNIVRQLWRFEEQNKHSAELASRATKVYQKLNTFLSSMEQVGRSLTKARETYDIAVNQLVAGKDNLIKQANTFKDLGVSVVAALPENLTSRAELELDHIPDLPATEGESANEEPPRG